jgi:chromosome segregation ATPase
MKNQMGIVILILICVGLGATMVWNRKDAAEQQHTYVDKISSLSNNLVQVSDNLNNLRQVNTENEARITKQSEALLGLTNVLNRVQTSLTKTESSLKTAQEQVAQRDTRIADLESQNLALDQRALELSTSITNLTSQIDDTQKKLAASEGDKVFLEKELQRLMAEKADLEKQFNDLAVLRAQVAKLKEELNVSRRLEWIRKGLFASGEQKGSEQLMQKSAPRDAAKQPSYDLNVEVSADGSVRVIPPLTNTTAATNSPAPK